MKLCFSTRGWDSLSWQELIDSASENGFCGIEPYNLFKRADFTGKGCPFHEYSAVQTSRELKKRKLSIPCFDTSIDLASENAESVLNYFRLAADMSVPFVSVKIGSGTAKECYPTVERLITEAEKLGITLLFSTRGVFNDTKLLRDTLEHFACDQLGVLWDAHHTYYNTGELPSKTIENLGAYIKHIHLKDSDDSGAYTLIGEGKLPVADVMRGLSSINYDGFISLEWKPIWMEELTDHEVIFPHFVNYLNRFDRTIGKKKTLYLNHDGTGEYIWKQDEILNLTFSQVLDRLVDEFPNQYCFKYTTLDYTRTYEEFRKDVDTFAKALLSLGVKAGTKVAVWATNVPEWFISFWAATKIGAILVAMNTAYKIHEAEYLLRQSDTHTLIMIESCLDSDYKGIINELCPEIEKSTPGTPLHCKKLPFLRNVITVGFRQKGCLTFDEAMQRASGISDDVLYHASAAVRPDDVCNMQYTSGTTGFPKGVMLTHYNVINNGKSIGDRLGLSTADRMMIQVPMFHCFGMVLSMTSAITHGATVCPLPYFSAKSSLACINQEHITCFNGVPTMFIAMFNHPDYKKTDFSHIRTGIMAGAGCPPELMRKAALPDEMNMRGIVSVYGQTESAPGNTMSAWTDSVDVRCDTVGYAFPHILCKIIDPATGEELPDGENGEFCSKGYNIMKGYYKMPDETKAAVDEDGWLHSGDLACRNPDGTFRITGRLKDMIIRGGENIYPKEIEEFIYTHPKVRDVQVIGVPDRQYGEEAMACIIVKDGESITVEEMLTYIKSHLARHKVPKYIEFVESFPMNAAGKVLKYKMREEAVKRLNLE